MDAKWTDEQIETVCAELGELDGRSYDGRALRAARLILEARAERDEALARVRMLEMLNDPEAGAKQMLMQRLAALETERDAALAEIKRYHAANVLQQFGTRTIDGMEPEVMGRRHLCDAWEKAVKARDEARAERDTLHTYIDKQMDAYAGQTERMAQLRRDRDAALARVKERDARDACRLERIAALKAERDEALARAQQLEGLAPEMLEAAEEAETLEAENVMLRQRTAELEAERSRWTYASPWHLKALSYECAKLGVAVRLAGFTPIEQHVRIAENERLRRAFDKALTDDEMGGPGLPALWYQLRAAVEGERLVDLRAAMEGKGDE